MNAESNILNYQEKTHEYVKTKVLALPNEEKKLLAFSGSVQEKAVLASIGKYLDILSRDANPDVRKEVVKYVSNYTNFADDPSALVRHAVVLRLKEDLEQNKSEIKLDDNGEPYVVNTPERDLLRKMSQDLSTVVSITAKDVLANLQRKELREAVKVVLNSGGLKDVACLLGNTVDSSLSRGLLANEIEELPVKNAVTKSRKVGVER